MKDYYRVWLGQGSVYAEQAVAGGYIGVDGSIDADLSDDLPDDWRAFNKKFIPVYLQGHPDKSKVAAGLVCGGLWTVSKGIKEGDVVLCPDGSGDFRAGEVTGGYRCVPGNVLPHQRPMHWYPDRISPSDMSEGLQKTIWVGPTVVRGFSEYADEFEALIAGTAPPTLLSTDEAVEDPSAFAMEQHLEEFLVANWNQTELAKEYDIYTEDGQTVGQQYKGDSYKTDTYDPIVPKALEHITAKAKLVAAVTDAIVGLPAPVNEMALQRIERRRREAAAKLLRDRDYVAPKATMDKLDTDEAEVRATVEEQITPCEVADALSDMQRLFRKAEPRTQQRLAQALFKRVDVLGPLQVWVHPSEEAEALGWATAMQGEFTSEVRRNGRGERAHASMSDLQVVRFVSPPVRESEAEASA